MVKKYVDWAAYVTQHQASKNFQFHLGFKAHLNRHSEQ